MSTTVQEVNLNPKGLITPIRLPDCYTKIAELAFYTTNATDFEPGHEQMNDRIETERKIKEMTAKRIHGKSHLM